MITAISATPTSEKIASHIDDKPIIANMITKSFTANEKTMFSFTISYVLLLILIASLIFVRLSEIITISLCSIASSLPQPPIDIPISA